MNMFDWKDKKVIVAGIVLFVLVLMGGYHCPIYTMIGIPCPGCGMTRAFLALIQGDLHRSIYFHALCIPTLIIGILYGLHTSYRNQIGIAWCVLMLGYYAYRMVVIFPDPPMHPNPKGLIPVIWTIVCHVMSGF